MNEETEEEKEIRLQRIVDKWKHVINFDDQLPPLSTRRVTAMLIESQECWIPPETLPKKYSDSATLIESQDTWVVQDDNK